LTCASQKEPYTLRTSALAWACGSALADAAVGEDVLLAGGELLEESLELSPLPQAVSVTKPPVISTAVARLRVRTAANLRPDERRCTQVTLSPRTTRCDTTAAPALRRTAAQNRGLLQLW